MPALLLLKSSPVRFAAFQLGKAYTPRTTIEKYIQTEADDVGWANGVLVFVHRWNSLQFDPFTFARAKTFLRRITHIIQRAGYQAEPIEPLSPETNLPRLAEKAGLGNLSPYGLLVHPKYGPRLILSGLRTDYPRAQAFARSEPQIGCTDCMVCTRVCPQEPLRSEKIDLKRCQSCAKCLELCPTGKASQGK